MKTNRIVSALALVLAAAAAACAQSDGGPTPTANSGAEATTHVEQALADVDTGRDLPAARAKLEALFADSSLPKEQRARVAMSLAQLVAPSDKERAATLLEEACKLGEQSAENRLFSLLAGHEPPSSARRTFRAPIADSARTFARYFPPARPDAQVGLEILELGGGDAHVSESLGTFDIGGALREQALEACGLCDDVNTKIHTHTSRERLWSAIPRYAATMPKALVVLYVAEDTMVPARYAQWLAVSNDEIRAAFARGEGLYAVKEREGAPPLVTIAAPRAARFALVERAFSEMREVPKKPVTVKLPSGLTPDEVQSGVRDRFSAFRGCYEKRLTRVPTAAGRIDMDFAIRGDGKPADVSVAFGGTLEDAEMRACVEKTVASLGYPAWSNNPSEKITVKYPITLRPD